MIVQVIKVQAPESSLYSFFVYCKETGKLIMIVSHGGPFWDFFATLGVMFDGPVVEVNVEMTKEVCK